MITFEEFQTQTSSPLQKNLLMIVVIPAFQAVRTIPTLVQEIKSQGIPVLVVDDGSADHTALAAELAGAAVISKTQNGGKGLALREGFRAALKLDCEWILTMDADGQHLPQEIADFIEAANQMNTDLVIGNRMWNPEEMPLIRRITNHLMSWLISLLTGKKIPDSQCGFRLISRRVLESIEFSSEAFEIESEMIIKAAWSGFRIASIPISSVYEEQKSFIRPLLDSFRFIKFLISLKRCAF